MHMEREIIIRLKLPQRLRRRWLLAIGATILGGAAIVYAAVPNSFTAGDSLSAQKLNDNFNALVDVSSSQTIGGAKTFSSAAVFNASLTSASLVAHDGINSDLQIAPVGGLASQYYISTTGGAFNPASDLVLNVPSGNGFELAQANVDALVIDTSGRVGIGTSVPDSLLTVNGIADKPGGGSWNTFSDERLKNITGQFTAGLDTVMRLQPVRYEYKKDNALKIVSSGEHIGFSAQAVQRVLPEAVTSDAKGYLLVNNDPILWTMLNAIKEQQAEIAGLRAQLDALAANAR
jgi:hypothetical protein